MRLIETGLIFFEQTTNIFYVRMVLMSKTTAEKQVMISRIFCGWQKKKTKMKMLLIAVWS